MKSAHFNKSFSPVGCPHQFSALQSLVIVLTIIQRDHKDTQGASPPANTSVIFWNFEVMPTHKLMVYLIPIVHSFSFFSCWKKETVRRLKKKKNTAPIMSCRIRNNNENIISKVFGLVGE